ncbi:unnamed protein product [Coffea canephora]|uniref:Uncharacterized protein n=1 Tax=Coffea canephora TaxID=49390 RepID=A0A068V1R5_COFCA|nr:unnamed protein product [Coffea canephora]
MLALRMSLTLAVLLLLLTPGGLQLDNESVNSGSYRDFIIQIQTLPVIFKLKEVILLGL